MKKTIFSFAIAAVAALMVSCGGKTENAAGGETTSEGEQAEGEQATEQVVEEEDANTLSTDAFSMATPEDFEINGKPEYLQKNHEISFRTKAGVTPTYEIKINHDANITFDARQSDITKLKAIDPIKVGDVSFQGGWQPDGKSIVLYADLGDKGTARVFLPKPSGMNAPDDAAVIAKLTELLSALPNCFLPSNSNKQNDSSFSSAWQQ